MSDSKPPKPKPMPTTSLPDRHDPKDWSDMNMKKGVTFGQMQVTNGRK